MSAPQVAPRHVFAAGKRGKRWRGGKVHRIRERRSNGYERTLCGRSVPKAGAWVATLALTPDNECGGCRAVHGAMERDRAAERNADRLWQLWEADR